ncbi:hypothetical protein LPH50_09540 [Xylella taiwanensis]|uniref:Uncharacterized protein n=3 Tax=Xylella taiwanensis TaxID=1444770 RepID=Z9JLZ9_9GAMM|nr:hypothetical protein [Xylella taiwanensis]EWS78792.1 hypothetical protein AF72_04265 [Xylella taiwanensis]MCD8456182.1 hypothetical protein [Xylella taiwanensis]MCD8458590.1 hypothetical protein [Xylella taiwanensis]MCD8463216.1 hypothetical protein [Xylella taiwanensis]UFN01928.1 hypothetical protein LPH43_09615 [Xylella taiwanensis]
MNGDLGDYRMSAPGLSFTCKYVDVAAFKKHDRAVIAGQHDWLTHDPQPDGIGMTFVWLAPWGYPSIAGNHHERTQF